MSPLRRLSLRGCGLRSAGIRSLFPPSALRKLQELEMLDLSRNQLSDAGVSHLRMGLRTILVRHAAAQTNHPPPPVFHPSPSAAAAASAGLSRSRSQFVETPSPTQEDDSNTDPAAGEGGGRFWPGLRSLNLSHNPLLGNSGIRSLRGILPQLEGFFLHGVPTVTEAGLLELFEVLSGPPPLPEGFTSSSSSSSSPDTEQEAMEGRKERRRPALRDISLPGCVTGKILRVLLHACGPQLRSLLVEPNQTRSPIGTGDDDDDDDFVSSSSSHSSSSAPPVGGFDCLELLTELAPGLEILSLEGFLALDRRQSLQMPSSIPGTGGGGGGGDAVEIGQFELVSLDDHRLSRILRRCRKLKILNLRNSPLLTDSGWEEGLQQDESLPQDETVLRLTHVNLSGCPQITDRFLRVLRGSQSRESVVELVLDGCDITDDGITAHLRDMPELRALSLTPTHPSKITDASLRHLGKHFPKLRLLRLTGCSFTSLGLEALVQGCTELEDLSLNRCGGVDTRSVYALTQLQRLHTLDLSRNPLVNNLCCLLLTHCRELVFVNLTREFR